MEKRHIAILGATGSIGTQTLDVVRQHPDLFEVELLTAGSNAALLVAEAREFNPAAVVICNESRYDEVAEALRDTDIKVFTGTQSMCDLVAAEAVDIVVAAMVGFSGLRPTVAALKAGKAVALANKETLVAAGPIVMDLSRRCHAPILPVDSEHSAIFQCLLAAGSNKVKTLHLTASGGPFRGWPREHIALARKEDALKHPNWSMGAKITIDSATMMNKGFEVIEACRLFDVTPEEVHVVVHPESVIHSMIEFEDGAVLAQLGCPDMRVPIQFALSFPERFPLKGEKLDFARIRRLTFEEPDREKFPCLGLAFEAVRRGGNIPCAMNAANEAAVKAYLEDRIRFYDISEVIAGTMAETPYIGEPSLDDIFATNEAAYAAAEEKIARK
jgi:1-deoxy-D-xylulose-5-phosphate reductoisomerase